MYAVPKGGDLHNHLGGAGFDDILFELATDDSVNGHQTFRTRVRINECSVDCGAPLAYFHTVSDRDDFDPSAKLGLCGGDLVRMVVAGFAQCRPGVRDLTRASPVFEVRRQAGQLRAHGHSFQARHSASQKPSSVASSAWRQRSAAARGQIVSSDGSCRSCSTPMRLEVVPRLGRYEGTDVFLVPHGSTGHAPSAGARHGFSDIPTDEPL